MEDKRLGKRIRHEGFFNFQVKLTYKKEVFTGHLGDISESGMSLLIKGDEVLNLDMGETAYICIQSSHLAEAFETTVTVVREESYLLKGQNYRLVGLSFPANVILPDTIIAIDMMNQ